MVCSIKPFPSYICLLTYTFWNEAKYTKNRLWWITFGYLYVIILFTSFFFFFNIHIQTFNSFLSHSSKSRIHNKGKREENNPACVPHNKQPNHLLLNQGDFQLPTCKDVCNTSPKDQQLLAFAFTHGSQARKHLRRRYFSNGVVSSWRKMYTVSRSSMTEWKSLSNSWSKHFGDDNYVKDAWAFFCSMLTFILKRGHSPWESEFYWNV